jgi:hypothetical protein
MRVTSFLVALLVILTPFIAFADPDCSSLPPEARAHNPQCTVGVPEYWGVFEYIGYLALVSVVFLVMVRLRILRRNHL